MKAIVYHEYGSPDVLQYTEVPKPVPKENEVLVKIHSASFNSWDYDMLIGTPFLVRVITGFTSPRKKILGADIAGRVEAVGSMVTQFKPGDDVFGDIAGHGFGGFAEYVTVPEDALAIKPEGITYAQAAALPQAGLLAIQGLRDKGLIKKGDKVLINGAAGGVGTLGLHYAKWIGAEVTCVDRGDKLQMLTDMGADHVIDFTTTDYTKTGKQYDIVLDVIAHRTVADYKRALTSTGKFIFIGGNMGRLLLSIGFVQPLLNKFRSKQIGMLGYRPNRADLNYLAQLCEEGIITPVIDSSFQLSQTADAFRRFKNGSFKGKIMISVTE